MGTRQWGRLFIVIAIIAAIATVGASGVSAHAQIKAADPAANAVIPTAPTQINLTFSEETSPTKSSGSVTNASGATVSTGFKVDLNERTKMAIALMPNLPNGVYTVKWNTLTEDDNGTASGAFTFTVQAAAAITGTATTGTIPAGASAVTGTVPAAATTAPTATVAATTVPPATTAPTSTRPATPPAATGTGGGTTVATTSPATLPKTGNTGSGSDAPWAIIAVLVAVLTISGGLIFRRRLARR